MLTTRWNIDELAGWLRAFVDHMSEEPYPVDAEGNLRLLRIINARKFDSDDEEEFDAYYDRLDGWNLRHRWHSASARAILADVYFQLVGDVVEMSWSNEDAEEGVKFKNMIGGARVKKDDFCEAVEGFLNEYEGHWGKLRWERTARVDVLADK